jgi:hypothetical protein
MKKLDCRLTMIRDCLLRLRRMERLSGIIAPSLDLICTEGKSVKNIEAAEGNPSFGEYGSRREYCETSCHP